MRIKEHGHFIKINIPLTIRLHRSLTNIHTIHIGIGMHAPIIHVAMDLTITVPHIHPMMTIDQCLFIFDKFPLESPGVAIEDVAARPLDIFDVAHFIFARFAFAEVRVAECRCGKALAVELEALGLFTSAARCFVGFESLK